MNNMRGQCRSNEELQQLVDKVKKYINKGTVADYIPALKKANPGDLSVSIYEKDIVRGM